MLGILLHAALLKKDTNSKGGDSMAKKNHTYLKDNKNVQPKGEAEFAGEAGLEKVVLQSQKKSK